MEERLRALREALLSCKGPCKESIEKLKPFLRDKSKSVRFAAIEVLSLLFRDSGREDLLVKELIPELSSPERWVREAAMMTVHLTLVSRDAKLRVLPLLSELMRDDNAQLRHACSLLFMLVYAPDPPLAKLAIENLAKLLLDERSYVRNSALVTILSLAEDAGVEEHALEILVRTYLSADDEEVYYTLLCGIVHMFPAVKDKRRFLRALLESLATPSNEKRSKMIVLLKYLCENLNIGDYILSLAFELARERRDTELLRGLSMLLSSLLDKTGDWRALDFARILLEHEEKSVKEHAAVLLTSVFKKSGREIELLRRIRQMLGEFQDRLARLVLLIALIETFKGTGKEDVLAREFLDIIKREQDFELKFAVACAFREIADALRRRRDLVARFYELLSGDIETRHIALIAICSALEGTRDPEIVGFVRSLLRSEDEISRALSAFSLGLVFRGTGDKMIFRLISPLVRDEDCTVRHAVARAIGLLFEGKLDREALSTLEELARDDVEDVRCSAQVSLIRIYLYAGRRDKALEVLSKLVRSEDVGVRALTPILMLELADKFPDVFAQVVEKLAKDPEPNVRLSVVVALTERLCAKFDERLLKVLEELALDRDWRVAHAAVCGVSDVLMRHGMLERLIDFVRRTARRCSEVVIPSLASVVYELISNVRKPDSIVDSVLKMARDRSWRVREVSALALAWALRDEALPSNVLGRVREVLDALIHDRDAKVSESVKVALGDVSNDII